MQTETCDASEGEATAQLSRDGDVSRLLQPSRRHRPVPAGRRDDAPPTDVAAADRRPVQPAGAERRGGARRRGALLRSPRRPVGRQRRARSHAVAVGRVARKQGTGTGAGGGERLR